MNRIFNCILWLVLLLVFTDLSAQKNSIQISGQMRNVMRKGELFATIALDTIHPRAHLYGFGPEAYLKGEITIIDGHCYRSRVISKTQMKVEETFDLKAPFLGYTYIEHWQETSIPETVHSLLDLENYLTTIAQKHTAPFFFKLVGTFSKADIHLVNLPDGSQVSSPEEAHQGQVNYILDHPSAEVIGFFSTEHQGILTKHDTFLHLHLISADRSKMGHVDAIDFNAKQIKLYLPAE